MIIEPEYSFDDEVVPRFCYELYSKKIEISFSGYFDFTSNQHMEYPHVWTIEAWEDARSGQCRIGDESKYSDLNDHIEIFSMILDLKISENDLYITVETIDDRYLDIIFVKPKLNFVKL